MKKEAFMNSTYRPDYQWLGRNLANYKQMHMIVAKNNGVAEQLQACSTLTQARKIVYGYKKGQRK